MFELAATRASSSTGKPLARFILSMTRSAADVLGAYVLAKEAGLFLDDTGVEACTLPIVPLFETITDLRAAPAIMRELCPAVCPAQRPGPRRDAGSHDWLFGLQ